MKFLAYARTVFFLLALLPLTLRAELPNATVYVLNLPVATGTVEVSLFDSEESFLKEPFLQQSGRVGEDGSFATEFVSLPAGEYAVVVVHDANDNGKLDSGFLGFGGEGYGYSNNVRPWFGRPSFEEVKFAVDQTSVVVEIDFD